MFSKFCWDIQTIGFDLKSHDVHIFNAQIVHSIIFQICLQPQICWEVIMSDNVK